MDVHASEQEQIEALKKWWRENGVALIVGAVIGLGGLFGWRYWQGHIDERGAAASLAYESLLIAAQSGQHDAALSQGEAMVTEYADTPYAALGRLLLAKVQVEKGDLEGAKAQLQAAALEADSEETRHVARIRLGRVLLALGDHAALESLLQEEAGGPFASAYEELRGDLRVAQGDTEGARAAYRKALAAGPEAAALIQLKLDDLGTPADEAIQ